MLHVLKAHNFQDEKGTEQKPLHSPTNVHRVQTKDEAD